MTILLLILLGLVSLWWLLRMLPAGADGHGLLPYLIAFVRFLWMPTASILLIALFVHQWTAAAIAAGLTIPTGLFASPWYRRLQNRKALKNRLSPDPNSKKRDSTHTVMTLNCRYGAADPQAIIEAVRNNDVSMLALQELTTDLVDALDSAGLGALLPYRQLGEAKKDDNGGFNGLWLLSAPESMSIRSVDILAADVPRVSVQGVAIYSAHTKSPMRGCREWSQGIMNLVSARTLHVDGHAREVVVMGDLNSNLDHPSFRKLTNAGYRDAGLGISHTDAASFPSWLAWPRLELDHILVTDGIATSDVRTLMIPGSDHLALLARLKLKS
jgi:endonuclease/exonuclease/phosphatase (EEP) superfamily protein YafD